MSRYVCARCKVPCAWWHGGWKHSTAERYMGQTCHKAPEPLEVLAEPARPFWQRELL